MTEAAALAAFVRGTISFNALRNALVESTDFVFEPNGTVRITSHRPLPVTVVRPSDIERALRRYQGGELTIEEVSIWGLVLGSLDAFDLVLADEKAQDAVWDVLAQISVASINDAFDAMRVAALLEQVEDAMQP
jgi:hypothetical protein